MAAVDPTEFVNFEGKQTSPIRLSPDGTRLFAVNTPDNRLSVFDVSSPHNPILIAEIPVGLEPVSVNPLNKDEAWVIAEVSDCVSVVSVSRQSVIDTLQVKDEPADVAFANGRAFITAGRKNQIAVFDIASRTSITNIPVIGESPRAIVANTDGTRVYAAMALSGNRTTLIPADPTDQRLDQPEPINPSLPLPPPPSVGRIVDAADPTWNDVINYTMPDNDVVELDTDSLVVTRYFSRVATVNFAIAIQPGSGDLFVAGQDASNLTRFEPVLKGSFTTNLVSRVQLNDGSVQRMNLNTGVTTNFPNLQGLTNALAQPVALAFSPGGEDFFIAAFGTDRIALVDSTNGNIKARIELNPDASGSAANPHTKRGPRGLALKPGVALYVLNRIANSITVVDPTSRTVVRELPVGSFDPTPTVIRQGRGFLYDAKLSGNGTVSCASCHIDAEMDMLAWDLGDPTGSMQTNLTVIAPNLPPFPSSFHPMKGPMVTQTLRGLQGLNPLHWRGDRTNFLAFNGAFASLLGGSVLSQPDMQAYSDFINTIVFEPNPNQNLDRTLPTSFAGGDPQAGLTNFTEDEYRPGLSCNTCHTLPTGTVRVIIPAAALQQSQDFKIPHLRNLYKKLSFNNTPGAVSIGGFGFLHDGTDADLVSFLSRPIFQDFADDEVIKSNLNAFMQCFDTGTAPAVGYARTMTFFSASSTVVSNDWTLLESQAATDPNNIDLILNGTLEGVPRSFLYDPTANLYSPNSTNHPTMTRTQLRASLVEGDALTVMGVPPGLGRRLSIDRDLDGQLDGDRPPPVLEISTLNQQAILTWPTTASGFVLEQNPWPSTGAWLPATNSRGTVGGQFSVTNTLSASNRFFRLRGL